MQIGTVAIKVGFTEYHLSHVPLPSCGLISTNFSHHRLHTVQVFRHTPVITATSGRCSTTKLGGAYSQAEMEMAEIGQVQHNTSTSTSTSTGVSSASTSTSTTTVQSSRPTSLSTKT